MAVVVLSAERPRGATSAFRFAVVDPPDRSLRCNYAEEEFRLALPSYYDNMMTFTVKRGFG